MGILLTCFLLPRLLIESKMPSCLSQVLHSVTWWERVGFSRTSTQIQPHSRAGELHIICCFSPRQYVVICLNSCVVSLKYWIIQPHGPRVNHDQNAAVTLIISSKAWVGIVFVAWFIALSQPRMHSFVLCPGPRQISGTPLIPGWLRTLTLA